MNKLISLVLSSVILGSGMVAKADTFVANTAKNQRGVEVSADYGGYDATRIASVTQEVICSGRCVLAGLIPSTGATGALIKVYDTSVAEGTGEARLKVAANFWPTDSGPATGKIPRPIRFTNGISVKLTSIASGEAVTVLYVDLDSR